MIKNLFKITAIFILGAVGGIFSDQILWPYFIERPLFYQYNLDQGPVYISEIKRITIEENTAIENAVEKTEKAVIAIKTTTKDKQILEGSGLIISSDGLIVTLEDLIPQGSDFLFFVDGKALPFQILKRDLKENLALAKVEATNLSTVGFGDFDSIKLGERVFSVGVFFEEKNIQKTVNEGIIKSFSENLIKTNITEEKSFNGSPLFDVSGNVLGLNIIDKEGKINAIPISKIRQFTGL